MKLKKLVFNRIVILGLLIAVQLGWFVIFLLNLTSESWWIHMMMQALSILALIVIINKNDNPAYKLAWAIPVLSFPLLGGLAYLFFGGKKPVRSMRRKIEASEKELEPYLEQDERILHEIEQLDRQVYGQVNYILNRPKFPIYQNTETKYYRSGEENYPDILEALREAQHYIFLEYFIIGKGIMWDGILEILKQKAACGVDVRLLYDDFGCLTLLPYQYKREIESYGIKCEVFNKMKPFFSTIMNHRDHRKILVVDGYIGFTGGINLADEYINEKKRFGYWKDTGIRLRGEAVWNMTVMFLTMWNSIRKMDSDYLKFKPGVHNIVRFTDNGYVQPYGDSPLDHETVGENVYLNIINMAKDYVYIYTPYLIIDHEMVTALCLASKRGVKIKIITPGIPDKKMVFYVTQSYYRELVEAGIEVYQFTPGFVHAKCFVCDDEIATVGTINMDYRSLYLHFECGIYLYKSSTVFDVKQDFEQTLKQCEIMTPKLLERKLPVRIIQGLLRLFAPLM